MYIYLQNKCIEYYKCRGTNTVYVSFLDASKSFDKLKCYLTFCMLLKEAKTKVVIKHNVVSSTCKVFMLIHDLPGTSSATHVIVLISSIRVVQGFML